MCGGSPQAELSVCDDVTGCLNSVQWSGHVSCKITLTNGGRLGAVPNLILYTVLKTSLFDAIEELLRWYPTQCG